MIQRLRKKFIRLCMLACAGAFFILFLAIYGITTLQMNAALDALADLIAQNGGQFPPLTLLDGVDPSPGAINQESPFTTRFFTVAFQADGTAAQVDVGAVASVTEEEAVAYGETALAAGKERGWIGVFRYRVYQGTEGIAAVFINGTEAKAANQRFLMGVFAVLLGGGLVVLLLAALFSRRAVRPMAEAYEKQKRFITDANHALKTPPYPPPNGSGYIGDGTGARSMAQRYERGGGQHVHTGGASGDPMPDGRGSRNASYGTL